MYLKTPLENTSFPSRFIMFELHLFNKFTVVIRKEPVLIIKQILACLYFIADVISKELWAIILDNLKDLLNTYCCSCFIFNFTKTPQLIPQSAVQPL